MEPETPPAWLPEGENYTMKFNEEGAKWGLRGGFRFYSFVEAVVWDMLLEAGYAPHFLDHGSSVHDYARSISKVMKASVRPLPGRRWYRWSVGQGPTFAWMYVRQGMTDDLFRELQAELNKKAAPRWDAPWGPPVLYWRGERGTEPPMTTWEPWSFSSELVTPEPREGGRQYPAVPQHLREDPRVLRWRQEQPLPTPPSSG